MRFEFVLTHGEFARAWLAEYYQTRRWGTFRVLGGPALALLGYKLHTLHRGSWVALIAGFVLGYGIYYAFKPLLRVVLLIRQRQKLGAHRITTVVELGQDGIRLTSGSASVAFGWDRVAVAGMRASYVWFEVTETTRGTIPRRAIPDLAALEQVFRDRGKWA